MPHGPYCRLEGPSQTPQDAAQQVASGEIWGRVHKRNAVYLCVKAYPRRLTKGERGVSFNAVVPHDPRFSAPHEARWYFPQTPGVMQRKDAQQDDVAAIPARVTNRQP